jgi:hypothetical protein
VTIAALLLQFASILLGLLALALAVFAWTRWQGPGVAFAFAPLDRVSISLAVAAVVSWFASIYAWRKAVQLGLPITGQVIWWRE